MLQFLFNNDCKLILFFVLFPTGWFVFGKVNSSTKKLRKVTIPEDVLPDVYEKYKEAVEDVRKPESLRRLFKKNKEYEIHVKRLNEVNGYKKHNLLIKQINSPMIYINNPVESKIPHPFLSYEEFKRALSENVERQREHYTKLRKITLGKIFFRSIPTRTTKNGILLKPTSPKLKKATSNTTKIYILQKNTKTDKRNTCSVKQTTNGQKIKSKSKLTKSKLNDTTVIANSTWSTAFTDHRTTELTTKFTTESTTKASTEFAMESTTELITTEFTKKPTTESNTELTEVLINESNTTESTKKPTTESNTELIEVSINEMNTTELTKKPTTEFNTELTGVSIKESKTELSEELTTESTIELTEESTTKLIEETSIEPTTTKATRRTFGRPNVWMGGK